jgi:uncharacterized protein YjiS (DUF1127 family)
MTYHHTQTSQIALNLSNRAHLPALSQWAIYFANTVVTWDDRYKARCKLGTMPNERLADMGITPRQALLESRKPFWRA